MKLVSVSVSVKRHSNVNFTKQLNFHEWSDTNYYTDTFTTRIGFNHKCVRMENRTEAM